MIRKHLLDEGSATANRGKNAGVTVQEQGKMARTTVARLGGFTFLFYISASIVGTNLFARITKGDGIAAKLANIAAHRPQMGLCFILTLLTIFAALILAVALYALTRDEDADLALLALTCRVVEGCSTPFRLPRCSHCCRSHRRLPPQLVRRRQPQTHSVALC